MFSSSGYFRGVNCPFYANGLCERPYCHFRHSRVEEKAPNKSENGPNYSVGAKRPSFPTSSSSATSVGGQGDVASYFTSVPEKLSSPVESYKTANNKEDSEAEAESCSIPSFTEPTPLLPESNEEPVKYDSLPRISGLPKPKQKADTSQNLPSYVPTPKTRVQLIVKGSIPSYEPTPKYSTTKSKKSSKTIEYDPVKNFAFREKVQSEEESDGDDITKSELASETRGANGAENEDNEESVEGIFSDDNDENKKGKKVKVAGDDDLTDSDEDVSGSYVSKDAVSNYADFLTPSSYFTSKIGSPSGNDKSGEISRSSSIEENGHSKHKSSSHKSTHKHHAGTDSKSKHLDRSKSLSKSPSTSSRDLLKKSRSSSLDSRRSSTSSHKSASGDISRNHSSASSSSKPNDREKSSSSSSGHSKSSSHKDSALRSSSRSSSTSSRHSNSKSSTSEKENRHSLKHASSSVKSSSSKSSSSSSKSSSTSSLSKSGHESHKSENAGRSKHKPGSSQKSSTSTHKDHNGKSSSHSLHSSQNSEVKVKSERKDSISLDKHNHHSKDKSQVGNSKDKTVKEEKDIKVKSEGQKSNHKRPKGDLKPQSGNQVTKRRVSNITSDLFGEDSGGSGSDSDVQIVDVPPPPVYELSESGAEEDMDQDDDLSMSPPSGEVDLLSDSDTFDECLRIFQESERQLAAKAKKPNPDQAKLNQVQKAEKSSADILAAVGKKRMAHHGANQVSRPVKSAAFSRPRLSPAEVMHNRIVEMQKRALLRAAKREGRESELPSELTNKKLTKTSQNLPSTPSSSSSSSLSAAAASLISTQKKREAHTPVLKTPTKTSGKANTGAMWSPNSFYNKTKKNGEPEATSNNTSGKSKTVTIASTASKTEKRKAHEPTQLNLKRPIIPAEFGAKVPTNVRQRYLNLIIDEYLKFNPEETAFARGQEEEKAVYERASNKNIYLNVAVNAIKRIRTEALESQPSSSKKQRTGLASLSALSAPSSTHHMAQSHFATLGGSRAAKTSFTLHRSGNTGRNQTTNFTGIDFYERLRRYILTEEQLRENGFPRSSEDGSKLAKIYKVEERDKMIKDNERNCKRCGKRFYVAKDGSSVSMEECFYHYRNANPRKVAGSFESRHECCNERAGSQGCQVAKTHVHDRNKTDSLTGYMKTMSSTSSDKNFAVYSMDCEMVYTKAGLELARVTVVGEDNSVKYESLVKPDTDIIDYNTRFSGITEKDMKGVKTTLLDVQAVMMSMFSDKTILMGHSLESDLQSLKLIHSTVVDTSVVFPHRRGPPLKRALRNLMVDYLEKIIQADDCGHDSKEDAVACMQLMHYKVRNDAKGEGRRI